MLDGKLYRKFQGNFSVMFNGIGSFKIINGQSGWMLEGMFNTKLQGNFNGINVMETFTRTLTGSLTGALMKVYMGICWKKMAT